MLAARRAFDCATGLAPGVSYLNTRGRERVAVLVHAGDKPLNFRPRNLLAWNVLRRVRVPTITMVWRSMKHREKSWGMALAVVCLLASAARAQVEDPAASGKMQITSCLVYLTKSPDKTYECTATVAEACNGKQQCEMPIGYNLTGGKDVDPASGFLGKMVKITYTCGGHSRQRGPYQQNEHASMILECSGLP